MVTCKNARYWVYKPPKKPLYTEQEVAGLFLLYAVVQERALWLLYQPDKLDTVAPSLQHNWFFEACSRIYGVFTTEPNLWGQKIGEAFHYRKKVLFTALVNSFRKGKYILKIKQQVLNELSTKLTAPIHGIYLLTHP